MDWSAALKELIRCFRASKVKKTEEAKEFAWTPEQMCRAWELLCVWCISLPRLCMARPVGILGAF